MDVVRASKRLSYVLRHRPDSVGLSLDDAGWVEVDALLAALGLSRDELDRVVATNDKRRFAFDATGTRIRASQGHSVRVDLGYAARRPPAAGHAVPRHAGAQRRGDPRAAGAPSSSGSMPAAWPTTERS